MAQRDYVSKQKRSKSKKNNSRIIPNLMMAFAVILVVLFAGTLYFLSHNGKPVTKIESKPITEKPADPLPEKPEERFRYLKELEKNAINSNVVTPPPISSSDQEKERQQILKNFVNDRPTNNQTTTVSTPPTINTQPIKEQWLLQCGAFKDRNNAESLKAKLALLGMSSSIKSGSLHRIIVGPFKSKIEADNAVKSLKDKGISDCANSTK